MGSNNPGIREDGLREVREIRLRRGLSQADLSAKTGVAEFTISQIEAGKRANPRPSTLRKLAQALKVEVADLYGSPEHPLGEAPPSPEQRSFNHLLEEERRAVWEAAVDNARRLREGGRARLEELLTAWQASTQRGELRSARRGYLDEVEELFNKAHGATHRLADLLFAEGGIPAPDDWEEVRAADRFYWTLIEMMNNAGFVIQEHNSEPPTVEEREAV